MNKLTALLVAVVLLISVSASLAETSVPALGQAPNVTATISVYCEFWNEKIGKSYSADMTYDTNDFDIVKSMKSGFNGDKDLIVMNMDGIIVEMDWDYNAYSFRTNITPPDHDFYWAMSRACGLISAIAYDFPHTDREGIDRFVSVTTLVTDALEAHVNDLVSNGSASFDVVSDLGTYTFDLLRMEGETWLSCGAVQYPYNEYVKTP